MIRSFKTSQIASIFPGYTVKAFGDDYLLTPRRGTFPRENLVIERRVFFDCDDLPVNGPSPVLLSPDEKSQVARAVEFSLKGKPQSLLFLSEVVYNGNQFAYRIVRPCRATHLGIITKWDRSSQTDLGVGASRRYARNQGATVHKHSPKSDQRGSDFWLLPVELLTDPKLLPEFDQTWAFNIGKAIDDHAAKYPRDCDLIAACRRWVAETNPDHK